MKKNIILILIIILTFSCSKDDDGPIKGCMDPLAANYNSAAVESDGSCQYSLVGDWELTKYTLDSSNVLVSYKYLYFDIYANSTYDFWDRLTMEQIYNLQELMLLVLAKPQLL